MNQGKEQTLLFIMNILKILFVYYETIKRDLNQRLIFEYRCDENPKVNTERSTRLVYTVLNGGLELLKIETRLINENFASVIMG